MTFLRRPRLTLLVVAAAATACGRPDLPEHEVPCPGDVVTVAFTGGTTPDFQWTPACPVAMLEVADMSRGAESVWRVSGEGANVIVPEVRYGQTPAGAVELRAPAPLRRGIEYRVTLQRWAGEGQRGGLVGGGVARFTP
ncbi:MAG: hypothetical protein OER21_00530 [Gemmatimonadota bacterium]|nr:hypothetical protein [Gemmatimonadota bacterium]